jgi:hypothetical protein
MIEDPVNVFWVVVGLLVWPELTFCIVLWMLGHPLLGVLALLVTYSNAETVIRTRTVYR